MGAPAPEETAAVVPTGYDPGSYSCVRSLGRRGIAPIVASEHRKVPAAASRFCRESVVVPSPYDDLAGYADALLALASRPAVRTILPLRPHDPYVFAIHADDFASEVTLVVPPIETLETVHDRMRLYEAARSAGVPVPETRLLRDAGDPGGDVVVKSRYNLLAERYVDSVDPGTIATVKHVAHVDTGSHLDADALRERMHHEPIVQEFVPPAGEYLFGALYDRGEALATFQHRQIRGDSYVGGGGVFRKSTAIPELEAVGRTLLDSLEWHGLACIEYVKDAVTGEFRLIEINPRLWQSLPSAVRAGADFPFYYWLLATGRAAEIDPDYEVGVGTHMLYGELGYLRSVRSDESPLHDRPSLLAETASVVSSCLSEPHFDVLRLDDPVPFFRGLGHVLAK